MKLIAIAVVARNSVIGDGDDQPFKFREDWARFKKVTMGHPLIMGRKTHDAMGLLPGRCSIVITHDPDALSFPTGHDGRPRGIAVSTWDEAVAAAGGASRRDAAIPALNSSDIDSSASGGAAPGGLRTPRAADSPGAIPREVGPDDAAGPASSDEAYVIGGGQIYRMAWPHLDELDITEVHADAQGSVLFPEIHVPEWQEISREPRGEFDFVKYERTRG